MEIKETLNDNEFAIISRLAFDIVTHEIELPDDNYGKGLMLIAKKFLNKYNPACCPVWYRVVNKSDEVIEPELSWKDIDNMRKEFLDVRKKALNRALGFDTHEVTK